jgi:hypothetical protein
MGLIIERQAINWLSNRYGCNYNRLQKCIELDLRRQSIGSESSPVWPVSPPEYNIDNYKFHYFGISFDELKARFTEETPENQKSKSSYDWGKEVRDFIPHKAAKKLRELITFTVKLKGSCPDLKLNDETIDILSEIDKGTECDYESVPILRDYKIKVLADELKEAIDRKYKISFHRGVQIAFETFILFILMLSIVLKSNVLSLIYMIFVVRFLSSPKKSSILVHLMVFISITFVCQYTLLVVNLTDRISPLPFPPQFEGYPNNPVDPSDLSIKYMFPLFFKYEEFRDLRLAYLVGITIEQK